MTAPGELLRPYRRSAIYVDRILKGAKALGLALPQRLLLAADEVIQ